MQRDDALLDAYARTRWRVDLPAGAAAVGVGGRLDATGLALPGAIVTAYNPRSEPRGRAENARANAALQAELRDRGLPHVPALALGTGEDAGRWDEPGFLIGGLSRAEAVDLARRYGQNAILWVDAAGRASLVAAQPGFAGARPGDPLPKP